MRFRLPRNVTGVERACDLKGKAAAGHVCLTTKLYPHPPSIGTERNAVLVMELPAALYQSVFHTERARAGFGTQRLLDRKLCLRCADV